MGHRTGFLCGLFFSVFLINFSYAEQKPLGQRPAPTRLLYADEVLRLPDVKQDQYFEALREFMNEEQAGDSTFTQFLFDFLLGQSAAYAFDVNNCKAMLDAQAPDDDCINYVAARISAKTGEWAECSIVGGNVLKCPGRANVTVVNTIQLDRLKGAIKSRDKMIPGSTPTLAGGGAPSSSNMPPNAKIDIVKTKPGEAALAPTQAARPVPSEKPSDEHTGDVRCFFAGFLVEAKKIKSKNGTEIPNPCRPVRNICAAEDKDLPTYPKIDDEFKKSICSKGEEYGKCPNGKKSRIQSNGSTSNDAIVVCNPLLYGVNEKGAVHCVKKSKNASKDCQEKAKDNKSLKDLLAKNPKAFDSMVKALNKHCGYMGEKTGDVDQKLEEASKKGGWSKTGKEDMKETCKILQARVAEISKDKDAAKSGTAKPATK
jgi:hypothetical protein